MHNSVQIESVGALGNNDSDDFYRLTWCHNNFDAYMVSDSLLSGVDVRVSRSITRLFIYDEY
jgi:hypothetical protein